MKPYVRTRTGIEYGPGQGWRAITEVRYQKNGAEQVDRYEGEWRQTEVAAETDRAAARSRINDATKGILS